VSIPAVFLATGGLGPGEAILNLVSGTNETCRLDSTALENLSEFILDCDEDFAERESMTTVGEFAWVRRSDDSNRNFWNDSSDDSAVIPATLF
jgi:hypothetical protein